MELIDLVNFVISNDLTQMASFPTGIPDCDSQSPGLLNLFLSSGSSNWEILIMFVGSFSIDFLTNS